MPYQLGQGIEEILHADNHFVVLRADGFSHAPGVGKLAVGRLRVAHRERFDRTGEHPPHERGDGARIQAAAEEHAQRDVAHQAHAHGFLEPLAAFADPRLVVALLGWSGLRDLPIPADFERRPLAAYVQGQMMARHELANAREQRALLAHITEGQVFRQQRFLE